MREHAIVACDRADGARGRRECMQPSHAIEPEPRSPMLIDTRVEGFTEPSEHFEHRNIVHHNLDKSFGLFPSAHTLKALLPRGAPSCTAHQRHVLDLYTFRQSTRGLTILRGATSLHPPGQAPAVNRPLRYCRATTTSFKATTSIYYIAPANLSIAD